jgi:hypothetical protein
VRAEWTVWAVRQIGSGALFSTVSPPMRMDGLAADEATEVG